MKTWTFLLFLIFPILSQSQVTVKGLVTEQNSGNKPLAGVQIKVLGTTPEVTGNDGLFQLAFTGKKPGDRIIVSEIARKGYEIVNKDVVNNWVITNNPNQRTKIVMCPEGMIAQNTLKYYNISFDGLARGYNEQIRKYQEERDKALMDAQTYGEKMKLLAEQFENQQKYLEELAERFARENFDDCSEVHKQAFDAYQKGHIDEAIRILETVNSVAEIERAKKQYADAEKRIAELEKVQAMSDSIIRQNIRKLIFQADLYISEFRFEEAEKAYEAAVRADTTNFQNIIDFVAFLVEEKQYNPAMKWCGTALANAETKFERAQALRYIGKIQSLMNDFKGAEKNINEAIDLLTELADDNPMEYSYNLSMTISIWGLILIESNHFDDAIHHLLKALMVQENNNHTPEGEPSLTPAIYANLGMAFLQSAKLDSAEFWIKLAIRDLSNANDTNSIVNNKWLLSVALNNLSQVYYQKNEFDESISIILQSLAIIRELANRNPQRFNPDIAFVLNNLSAAYLSRDDYPNADLYAAEAEDILRDLAAIYPIVYNRLLANILNVRAAVQGELQNNEKAESLYMESVNILRTLASVNPLVYKSDLAFSLNNLSVLQKKLRNYDLALQNSMEAVDIMLEMEKIFPDVYKPTAGIFLDILAELYFEMNEFQKSEECFIQSIKKFSELGIEKLQYYKDNLYNAHNWLIVLYKKTGQFDKTMAHMKVGIDFYRDLARENPQDYLFYVAKLLSELSWIQYKSDVLQAISTMNLAMEAYHLCRDSGFTYPISSLAICYGRMARYQILNKRFDEAEKYALMSLETEPLEMNYKNLAHSLLYNGKYREAEEIYIRMKDKKCDCNPPEPYKKWFLRDLDEFEKAGIKHPDVKKIRKQLAN